MAGQYFGWYKPAVSWNLATLERTQSLAIVFLWRVRWETFTWKGFFEDFARLSSVSF
jgi:hypothetical protein